jgi:hypothetical protein
MIALTTPIQINQVLGGNDPVAYDKCVLTDVRYDTIGRVITARVFVSSTSMPEADVIRGDLTIDRTVPSVVLKVPQLDIVRRIQLTGPQSNAVDNLINNQQDALEAGLISINAVDGTQSTGQ